MIFNYDEIFTNAPVMDAMARWGYIERFDKLGAIAAQRDIPLEED